ncbi:hypothetical protein EDF58_103500 [Novosphingobium sp. PhB57]|uniref:hypothetical protein n=1 Tax=Novosphingobium sp. PhB57 TaxID=2485107 RepID=UPI0010CFA54A|nr:hypothetical protein [Novosphingobium sp. PhB57]TCU58963.1 hypothetical protein EDF58_103500 [Novosphingobium sp. PhB57]
MLPVLVPVVLAASAPGTLDHAPADCTASADSCAAQVAAFSPAPGPAPKDAAPETPKVEAAPAPAPPAEAATKARLKIGAALRGRYDLRFNDVGSAGQRRTSSHLSFDTLALTADYDSTRFFGAAQYRVYGGSFIYGKNGGYDGHVGEVNFLMYAYAGAKLNATDSVTVGVQPVPFDDRYWGSSILDDLGFVYGMEETYNLGMKFKRQTADYRVELGFFPSSGPNGMGISTDSSRYSTNIAKADSYVPDGSRNDERKMIVGNVQYALVSNQDTTLKATASAWISSIYNFDTDKEGSKHLFAFSLTGSHGPWSAKALVARQDIDPRNPGRNDMISVGGFDGSYNIAAKGTYAFGEIGRTIDTGKLPFDLLVYANYGRFMKDAAGFRDSERFDLGAVWTAKDKGRIKVFSEFLLGRNDPYVGAGQFISGAAQGGDDRFKAAFMMIFGYYF